MRLALQDLAYTLLVSRLQTDGFASDSMRMIKEVKKGKPDAGVQILLFSATFDDTIRTFANNIVGGAANQVSTSLRLILVTCFEIGCIHLHCSQTCLLLSLSQQRLKQSLPGPICRCTSGRSS